MFSFFLKARFWEQQFLQSLLLPPEMQNRAINFSLSSRYDQMMGVTFLCPHKKVTKESGIGEALGRVLPHGHTPSPMYPSRGALGKIFEDSTLYLSDF